MSYITPADLKGIGFDVSTLPADDVQAICDTACEMVDNVANQPFSAMDSVECPQAFRANGMVKVFPDNLPVISVASVTMFNFDGVTTTTVTDGFIINNQTGMFMFPCPVTANLSMPMTLNYRHGYEDGAVPRDAIKAAVLTAKVILDEYMMASLTGQGNVTAVTDGGRNIGKTHVEVAVPAAAKAILNNMTRIR